MTCKQCVNCRIVCLAWSPTSELCRDSLDEAIKNITALDIATREPLPAN